jgi:hypothetical protein
VLGWNPLAPAREAAMPAIVSENHHLERKCVEIRRQIAEKYKDRLEGASETERKKIVKAMEREISTSIRSYLGTHPRRPHSPYWIR